MAGYVAMSRIDRVVPRLRPGHGSADACVDDDLRLTLEPTDPVDLPDEARPALQDLSGAGFAADLLDLLADIRQVWRQGLEVLADPQGWRS